MQGLGVSSGIGIGNVLVIKARKKVEAKKTSSIEEEINKVKTMIEEVKLDLQKIYVEKVEILGEEKVAIFKAHEMILEDPELISRINSKIQDEFWVAEYAVQKTVDEFVEIFNGMENEYFKERAADIKDVGNRLIKKLVGDDDEQLENIDEHTIIIADDLVPSDTARIDPLKVEGFITRVGGATAHSAIIARTLDIPAITGIGINEFENNDLVIIDGNSGKVIINPSSEELEIYRYQKKKIENEKEGLKEYIGKRSITKDGIVVQIAANIAMPSDVKQVLENDGEGIGLFRSEFLYMNRDNFPSEEEQFNAYKEVIEQMKGKSEVIRTLDVGGDKEISYIDIPKESNPFLGYRAIRYCLKEKKVLETQLRALLRASAFGTVEIMFPMISCVEQVREAKEVLEKVKEQLIKENIPIGSYKVGIMIEIPSAAIMSDLLAKEVDFFSIGTNDLIQYTVAVDRLNENVKEIYSQYNPAVLRLINTVIRNAHVAGIKVGICGMTAGDQTLIPLFVAMGIDKLSMEANKILKVRKQILNLSVKEVKELLDKVLTMVSEKEIEKLLI